LYLYLYLPLPVLLHHPKNTVISTGGGAFAAAVERPPYFVFAVAVAVAVVLAHSRPLTAQSSALNRLAFAVAFIF
jgi:hypothetical protein